MAGLDNRDIIFKTTGVAVILAVLLTALLLAAGCTGTSTRDGSADVTGDESFKEEIDAVINQEKYAYSTWGMEAVDLDTGETLLSMN